MRKLLGFTIMEMLVVLVIMSLVSAFLFESIPNLHRNFLRIEAGNNKLLSKVPAHRWTRGLLGSALAVHPKDKLHSFDGSSSSIQALTMMPILSDSGRVTFFSLAIKRYPKKSVLEYSQKEGNVIELFELGSDAAFSFVNGKGTAFSSWPVEADLVGSLPALIMLDDGLSPPLKIAIKTRRLPVKDLRDVL